MYLRLLWHYSWPILGLEVHAITLQGKRYDCLLRDKKKLKRHLKREKREYRVNSIILQALGVGIRV